FFFQAADGIRDRNVTGVQTCALPISAQDRHLYVLFGRGGPGFVSRPPVAFVAVLVDVTARSGPVGGAGFLLCGKGLEEGVVVVLTVVEGHQVLGVWRGGGLGGEVLFGFVDRQVQGAVLAKVGQEGDAFGVLVGQAQAYLFRPGR